MKDDREPLALDAQPKPYLSTAEMATRPDFRLGSAQVSPSRRSVSGPGGHIDVEPRVMQVLVALADARNQVVTRQTLFDRCWGVSDIGDDSLNRAVAGVRRVAAEVAANSFVVETIPRTGYRLTEEGPALSARDELADARSGMSRRSAIAAVGAVGATAAVGIGLWSVRRRSNAEVRGLLDQGMEAFEYGDGNRRSVANFRRAVALDPDNAEANGLLALALIFDLRSNVVAGSEAATQEARTAAETALRLDPGNVTAQLAMNELHRSTLDYIETEDSLHRLLKRAPDNLFVLRALWNLLQSAGRSQEALEMVQRAIAVKPLAAMTNYPFGQLLWIVGRNAEADRILSQAIQLWPEHRHVRFARFNLLTYTGREEAALAMIDNPKTRPQVFGDESVAIWRETLPAMITRDPAAIAAAAAANIRGSNANFALVPQAFLSLSSLGLREPALDVADRFFAVDTKSRHRVDGASRESFSWRFSPWLFTPPAHPVQQDPRFLALCDGIGLSDYWRKRKVVPDFLRRVA